MLDDATLLRDYAENQSEQAFAELVRRHTNLVYSAALRRTGGDSHRAQEVVQFVFNELARKPEALARHPVLAGWFHTATRNAAFNVARAEHRRQFYEQQAALTMNEGSENAEAWVRLRPMLDEVIDGLARDDRDAVLLRYFDERPFADIGRVLRVSEDAARMRVQRALEKLRDALRQRGFTSTTAALGAVLSTHTIVAAPAGLALTVTGVALAGVGAASKLSVFGTVGAGLGGLKMAVIASGVAVLIAALTIGLWRKGGVTEDRLAITMAAARQTDAPTEATSASLPSSTESASNRAPTRNLTGTASVAAQSAAEPIVVIPPERAKVAKDYFGLLWDLRLPVEKREALITLLVDLRESGADHAAASARVGIDVTADPGSFNRSVRALREQIHAQIKELLGPDGLRHYLAFEEELKLKSYAVVLKGKLKHTPSPLTTEQADELTRIIQQRTFDPNGERLIAEASRFLSAEQLEALREVQDLKINGSRKPKILDAVREGAGQPASEPNAR